MQHIFEFGVDTRQVLSKPVDGYIESVTIDSNVDAEIMICDSPKGAERVFLSVDVEPGQVLFAPRQDTHDVDGAVRPAGERFYIPNRCFLVTAVFEELPEPEDEEVDDDGIPLPPEFPINAKVRVVVVTSPHHS